MLGKAFGHRLKPRSEREGKHCMCWPEESDSSSTQEQIPGSDQCHREQRHRFLDEVDKICAARRAGAEVSRAKACSANCCRSSKHDGFDQIRAGEDGSYIVHCLGCLPHRQAVDLLPDLQGRLPIRVELKALARDDSYAAFSPSRSEPRTQAYKRCSWPPKAV
jgi:ATP-dependent HslUV protease ATP-binding subunit HslU